MRNPRNYTDFERDLGRRKPNPHRGTPWVGTELDRSGESTGAFPGSGSSLPQDIGADGFSVEEPPEEERDDLDSIDTEKEEIAQADEFDTTDLNSSPNVDGFESQLTTLHSQRASRVNRIDEDETPLDKKIVGEMSESLELTEFPSGAETATAGEIGRIECPNCGFEYDAVIGTSARCPACNYEADLSNYVGDESFHFTTDSTFVDED